MKTALQFFEDSDITRRRPRSIQDKTSQDNPRYIDPNMRSVPSDPTMDFVAIRETELTAIRL